MANQGLLVLVLAAVLEGLSVSLVDRADGAKATRLPPHSIAAVVRPLRPRSARGAVDAEAVVTVEVPPASLGVRARTKGKKKGNRGKTHVCRCRVSFGTL